MISVLAPLRVATLALGFALASAVSAVASGADICERAAAEAARLSGVPPSVLHAITLTETGRLLEGRLRPWPWAINREGEGFWFGSQEEALAFARASLHQGRPSFDLGCFQINYRWHGDGFASLEAMADPDAGALYAARFLRDLHAELGSWSAAAGAYHSRTPEFAQRYRARFDQILAGLSAPPDLGGQGPLSEKDKGRKVRAPLVITVGRTGGAGFVAKQSTVTGDGSRRVISLQPESSSGSGSI